MDHLDDAPGGVARQEGAEHRLRELEVADDQQSDAEDAEDDRARPVGQELQCDVVEARRQVGCLVDLLQCIRDTEDQDELGHHEQKQPAFDLKPGREPAEPTRS